jgi:hypothetical protein
MFKFFSIVLILFSFLIGSAMAQSKEGLKDIVSAQQEKIFRIEDNLKKINWFD